MFRPLAVALGLTLAPPAALATAPETTPEAIRACTADRRAEGCATLLTRLMVCTQAPAIAGCAALLAMQDEAMDDIAPDLIPRAEGELAEEGETAMSEGQCPVIDSTDWRAEVGPVEGAEGPHLIVTGRVTLPTPGWDVTLRAGMADRSAMPVQQVILTASAGPGMVAQVLTDYDLRLEVPALASYRGVLILCGGEVLAELTEVGQAE